MLAESWVRHKYDSRSSRNNLCTLNLPAVYIHWVTVSRQNTEIQALNPNITNVVFPVVTHGPQISAAVF